MPAFLAERLDKRQESGLMRTLRLPDDRSVDFCSNDYLGFAQSPELKSRVEEAWFHLPASEKMLGSGGSRLLRGNSRLAQDLEIEIAQFHNAEAALLFNSGFDANLAVFSAIPERADTILYDELCHASIRDGIRLGLARNYPFRHNDLAHLQEKLKNLEGRVFVAVESVYSMDGDIAPLQELASICRSRPDTWLIIDEAHATGVFGQNGRGFTSDLDISDVTVATVYTFGKALGCHGAAVAGSDDLCKWLVNSARSFIYTTALPAHSLICIREAYHFLPDAAEDRRKLHSLIGYFSELTSAIPEIHCLQSLTGIQGIIVPGNDNARSAAVALQQQGFDVRPILSPTVPAGTERLRICLHSFNSHEDTERLVNAIKTLN